MGADIPINKRIQKHPTMLIKSVPDGLESKKYFSNSSFIPNLDTAPKAPPIPINIILLIIFIKLNYVIYLHIIFKFNLNGIFVYKVYKKNLFINSNLIIKIFRKPIR